ncbi:hypothetical protein P154DRAFT_528189 [Amniculicola lignicola CBS 123094]|uniref:Dynamin family protein n=1 Tax=Amniculicola lignicola CBS 123094 TaxID=1392246 RepID=A0A6A5VVG7_9PLEO|nr:hypothetical protein P154DRAFT_528189 [Amniculicola lignicola CBS 123094]
MAGTAGALEGTTLHELLSEDETKLLDTIDDLRSQGVGRLLGEDGLPALIVCGDQSSGKSSVLEALTRVRFPTKSSVCTTFPTELRLRRDPVSQIKCRIKPASSRTPEERERLTRFQASFDSPEKFPELITAARTCMSEANGDAGAFFEDILEVEITGPKLAPLTIVDLPGLIHHSRGSGDKNVALVKNMVHRYMAQKNSIILSIISAHNDIDNQIVLSLIKTIVPDGSRTLGIITKPDELPSGSEKEQEYTDLARTNPDKFQYGWHVVRNRAYSEQSSSFEERDEKEKDFLKNSNWAPLEGREVGLGIDTLRQKLSKMLLDHISLSLPSIITRLEKDLDHSAAELHKLGDARTTSKEQQDYLSNISDTFESHTKDALDGRYHPSSFFGDPSSPDGLERRLRAVVRNLNDRFADDMLNHGHKWQIQDELVTSEVFANSDHPNIISKADFIQKHVDSLAQNERANELPGISNPLLVGSLFRQQSAPWESIASEHLDTVWSTVKAFLETLLSHLTDDRTCNQLLIHVIDPAMEARQHALRAKLKELLLPYHEYDPINLDPLFANKISLLREERIAKSILRTVRKELYTNDSKYLLPSDEEILAKATSAGSSSKYGSNETLHFMQAYYEMAILGFINNVATLAVEQCLLSGLPKIYSASTIRNMKEEDLNLIASESRDVLTGRSRLTERVDILQNGLKIIRKIKPSTRANRSVVNGNEPSSTFSRTSNLPDRGSRSPSGFNFSLTSNSDPPKRKLDPHSASGINISRTPEPQVKVTNTASPAVTVTATPTPIPKPSPSGASPSLFPGLFSPAEATPKPASGSPAPHPFPGDRPFGGFGSVKLAQGATLGSTNSNTPGTGLFGSSSTTPTTGGLFGSASKAPATASQFASVSAASATGGLFGSTPTAPAAGGLFGNKPAAPTTGGTFGGQPAASTTGGTFGGKLAASTTGGTFGGQLAASTTVSTTANTGNSFSFGKLAEGCWD